MRALELELLDIVEEVGSEVVSEGPGEGHGDGDECKDALEGGVEELGV